MKKKIRLESFASADGCVLEAIEGSEYAKKIRAEGYPNLCSVREVEIDVPDVSRKARAFVIVNSTARQTDDCQNLIVAGHIDPTEGLSPYEAIRVREILSSEAVVSKAVLKKVWGRHVQLGHIGVGSDHRVFEKFFNALRLGES